jgi:hypothetical protein
MPIQLNNSITQTGNDADLYLSKLGGVIQGNLEVEGSATVYGGATIQNGLTMVNGQATLNGPLVVNGLATTLTNRISLNGNAQFILQTGNGTPQAPLLVNSQQLLTFNLTGNKAYFRMQPDSSAIVNVPQDFPVPFGVWPSMVNVSVTSGPNPPYVARQFIINVDDGAFVSVDVCICWA